MILIDPNYPASYNSPSQADLTLHSSQPSSTASEPPPYDGSERHASERYAKATAPQPPPINPQRYDPGPSRPPWSAATLNSQFSGTNTASSSSSTSPASNGFTHDPPPASFLRQPPNTMTYDSFQPMFLIANGKFLDKGFPPIAPPSPAQPHPFASHDVNEGDWTWFIDALRKAAMISDKQNRIATHVPLVQDLPVVNMLIAKAIKNYMKKKKKGPASDLVNKWNHHFFHPRKMEVVLMQGQTRLSHGGCTDHHIMNLHTKNDTSPTTSPKHSLSSWSQTGGEDKPSNTQGLIEGQQGVLMSTGKEKGKHKEEEDKIYRLYVVPL